MAVEKNYKTKTNLSYLECQTAAEISRSDSRAALHLQGADVADSALHHILTC